MTTHYERTPRQMIGVRRTQRGGVSSVKALLRRGADDWLFAIRDGSRVITLIDQFDKVLDLAGITHNSHGDKYTLYSLRHFYAVLSLRRRIGVFDVARNMGTSGSNLTLESRMGFPSDLPNVVVA